MYLLYVRTSVYFRVFKSKSIYDKTNVFFSNDMIVFCSTFHTNILPFYMHIENLNNH